MHQILKITLAVLAFLVVTSAPPAAAEPAEKRMALVIGNAAYQKGALATAANDAGLIAQTLQAAGFDVVGARDLDEDSLRHAFRDFVDNVSKAGPDTVVAVYFAGYGLQLEGENYLVPIDADIARDSDIPVRALRLSDYTHALAALHLKTTIVVLDAARANPFSTSGQPLAGGLALVEPEPGMLIAFNAAPGTVAPEGQAGYGPYAKAFAEMIREGGLPPADVFDRVRLRVNEMTNGVQVPWDVSKIEAPFVFFERGPDAPPSLASAEQTASVRSRPIRDLGAQDAYLAALARDTLDAYEDFLNAYPQDPMAQRVRALLAARREAMTWRRTYDADTPQAYWSYLRRYRRGSHAADARRRLAQLAAALEPPPSFAMIDYDVPPPTPDEVVYYERPVLAYDDPVFAFAPPPPPPVYFLEPPPPEFVVLEPPPPPYGAYILPVPVFVPVPVYVSAPAYVAAPPNPIIFNNIHNKVIINNTTNIVTITKPNGQVVPTTPSLPPAAGRGAGVPTLAPALPPSVAPKAALINNQNPPAPTGNPATQGAIKLPLGQALPATGNKPLPIPHDATLAPLDTSKKPLDTDKKQPSIPPAATLAPADTRQKPLDTDKKQPSIPPAATLAPADTRQKPLDTDKKQPSIPPAATLAPADTRKKPLDTDKKQPSIPPTATLAPADAGKKPPPKSPSATLAPVDTGKKTLSNTTSAPISQPAVVHRPAPPTPPVVHQVAPAIVHQAPPVAVSRPAPPPPPVVHPAPPPPVVRQVQAPPAPHPPPPPPPPAAAAAKPAAAAAKCPIVNGKPTCK